MGSKWRTTAIQHAGRRPLRFTFGRNSCVYWAMRLQVQLPPPLPCPDIWGCQLSGRLQDRSLYPGASANIIQLAISPEMVSKLPHRRILLLNTKYLPMDGLVLWLNIYYFIISFFIHCPRAANLPLPAFSLSSFAAPAFPPHSTKKNPKQLKLASVSNRGQCYHIYCWPDSARAHRRCHLRVGGCCWPCGWRIPRRHGSVSGGFLEKKSWEKEAMRET